MKYTYIVSPVGYNKDGSVDRATEPTRFSNREEADDFINDMGSRWVLYPNIEIYRVPGDGSSFSWKDAKFVVGYNESGEYTESIKATPKRKPTKKSKTRAKRHDTSSPTSVRGMRR